MIEGPPVIAAGNPIVIPPVDESLWIVFRDVAIT